MSTPDTSSDDATLAAAEALIASGIPPHWGESFRKVIAIARRLQGENERLQTLWSETTHEAMRQKDRAEKAEAEVRELRATIARVGKMLDERLALSEELLGPMGAIPYVIPIQDVQAALMDATTGDKT